MNSSESALSWYALGHPQGNAAAPPDRHHSMRTVDPIHRGTEPPNLSTREVAGEQVDRNLLEELTAFYQAYNREQVPRAAEVLRHFEGRERELNLCLRQKYGRDLSSIRT